MPGLSGSFLLTWVLLSLFTGKVEMARGDIYVQPSDSFSKWGQDIFVGGIALLVFLGIYCLVKDMFLPTQDDCPPEIIQETTPGDATTRPISTVPPTSASVPPIYPPQGPHCEDALKIFAQVLNTMECQLEGYLKDVQTRRQALGEEVTPLAADPEMKVTTFEITDRAESCMELFRKRRRHP